MRQIYMGKFYPNVTRDLIIDVKSRRIWIAFKNETFKTVKFVDFTWKYNISTKNVLSYFFILLQSYENPLH